MDPTSIDMVLTCWEKLGPMERSVLATIAARLLAGQRKYGELEEGKKVWTWEAAEEHLDATVYLAAGLVALTEASKRRYIQSLEGTHYSVSEELNKDGLGEPV